MKTLKEDKQQCKALFDVVVLFNRNKTKKDLFIILLYTMIMD